MVIPEVSVVTDSKEEFWLTWFGIVRATLDLGNPTPKELQVLVHAAMSPYDHPFKDMGAKMIYKKLNMYRTKYWEYRTSLQNKGWLDENFDFIPHIENIRNLFRKDDTKVSISFVMSIKYTQSQG